MRQFVCEYDGEEKIGVIRAVKAAAEPAPDVSRRAFEYIGEHKISFPYRKRCVLRHLLTKVQPPSHRPANSLRKGVIASIIE